MIRELFICSFLSFFPSVADATRKGLLRTLFHQLFSSLPATRASQLADRSRYMDTHTHTHTHAGGRAQCPGLMVKKK
jgi:hypothetical protein